jgi:hypothetical protein
MSRQHPVAAHLNVSFINACNRKLQTPVNNPEEGYNIQNTAKA